MSTLGHAAASDRSSQLPRPTRTHVSAPAPILWSIVSLAPPSYEQVFRTFSIALPETQLTGDAPEDADNVLDAIRAGHVYSTIDALATPGLFAFTAASGAHRAVMGDDAAPQRPVTLHVESNAPAGSTITLLRRKNGASRCAPPAGSTKPPRCPACIASKSMSPARRAPRSMGGVESDLCRRSTAHRFVVETAAIPSRRRVLQWPGRRLAYREERPIGRHARRVARVSTAPSCSCVTAWRNVVGVAVRRSPSLVRSRISLVSRRHLHRSSDAADAADASSEGDAPRTVAGGNRSISTETSETVTIAFDEMSPLGRRLAVRVLAPRDLLFVVDTVTRSKARAGRFGSTTSATVAEQVHRGASGPDGQQQVGRAGAKQEIRRPRREDRASATHLSPSPRRTGSSSSTRARCDADTNAGHSAAASDRDGEGHGNQRHHDRHEGKGQLAIQGDSLTNDVESALRELLGVGPQLRETHELRIRWFRGKVRRLRGPLSADELHEVRRFTAGGSNCASSHVRGSRRCRHMRLLGVRALGHAPHAFVELVDPE